MSHFRDVLIFLYMSTLGNWRGCRFVENIMCFAFLPIPHCTHVSVIPTSKRSPTAGGRRISLHP